MTGIPILAAVSAPSTLAIDLAHDTGLILIGFLRDTTLNIYTHLGFITSGEWQSVCPHTVQSHGGQCPISTFARTIAAATMAEVRPTTNTRSVRWLP
jgi:hypothetical protein